VNAAPQTKSVRRRDALAATAVAILAAQAVMFIVAAKRGFDLTDESSYLLTYRHWSEWPSVSQFGAYFSLPYALVDHDVWAMRILGFALLLAAAVWFGSEAQRAFGALAGRRSREGELATALASGAAIWNYYGAWPVSPTPSYNLLTLFCALVVLALALRLGRLIHAGERRGTLATAFALGLAGSIGLASKVSSGLLVLALAVTVVAALAWRRLDAPRWRRLVVAALAGLVLNLAALWIADPALPLRFVRGFAVAFAMLPRHPAGELAALVFGVLPTDAVHALRILLWPLVFAVAAFALGPRIGQRPLADTLAVGVFIAGALVFTFVKDNRFYRIVLLTWVAILLATAALWLLRERLARGAGGRALVVAGAMLAVPFAYSFGTNNALLQHMGMAAVFPAAVSAVLVRTLWLERAIPTWLFAGAIALLTALPVEIVVRQWVDGRYTYRLGASLAEQTVSLPANPGAIDLGVPPALARSLDGYLLLLRSAGFVPGQPMIDFTGQSPGLVAIANGAPVGAPWFVGGELFDGGQMAQRALGYVDAAEVRSAWLLTSEAGPTTIASWRRIVTERLGAFAHEEAGSFTIPDPSSDDKSKSIEVTLWKPSREAQP
jgi:hypothetical protein